jgi:hypothetical protein
MSPEERDYLRAVKNASKARSEMPCPMIMRDLAPYKNMLDGSIIDGRAAHRKFLKDNNLMELGNEKPIPHAVKKPSKNDICADIKESIEQVKAGYIDPEIGPLNAPELKSEPVSIPADVKTGDYFRSDII